MRFAALPILIASLIVATSGIDAAVARAAGAAEDAPTALRSPAYRPLPLGRIKPAGWLRVQLQVQAAALSGHLDEFWPDIKESAWIGGKAEGWERTPYWLDGLVPLAFLLDDATLQAKVKRFVDHILDHQQPDGWLGPIGDTAGHKPYDPWPLFPLFKALTQYHDATGDPRIVPALLRCARKIGMEMDRTPLYSWARMRAADFAVSLYWLHVRSGETWPLDVARKAFAQSHDWRAQFDDFKFTGKTRSKFDLDTHGVNTGMALKYGAMRYLLSGDPGDRGAIDRMLQQLDRYHGQATGIFTCDEHLAGRSPSQGTELCTVVEAMYSLELALAVTGESRLGDRLEKLAFNALPATFKKDMTAHQYDQQANQVLCTRAGEHVYVNNGPDSNLFGLEPNFGCCTANLHQGWPKFTEFLWMRAGDGLVAAAYAPCVVETRVQGRRVKLEVATDYPFRDTIRISVSVPEPLSFPLRLRIPSWAAEVGLRTADVEFEKAGGTVRLDSMTLQPPPPGGFLELRGRWSGTSTLTLHLPMTPRLYQGANDSVAIERGPLVYSLKVGAEWTKVKDNPQFADWEVRPTTPWNYALQIDREHPGRSVTFEERPFDGSPFRPEAAPVVARARGRRLPGWTIEKGAAASPPASPVSSTEPLEDLTLIPYGCSDLRITEFPSLATP